MTVIKNVRITDIDLASLRLLRSKHNYRLEKKESQDRLDRFVVRKAVEFCVAHHEDILRFEESNFIEDRIRCVPVYFTNEEFKALKKRADEEGISKSQFVQRLVSGQLKIESESAVDPNPSVRDRQKD